MRFAYRLLVYLLLLPYFAYWFGRALVNRSYRAKLGQRLGVGYPTLERSIWVHAVSVGEVVAAAPLVRALKRRYPERPLMVTTVTPTGAARVQALFGEQVVHAYIPFEVPFAVDNFFAHVDPIIALIIETEIWPNLYRGCGVRGIPLVLASARISPKSVGSYRRMLPLIRETLSHGIVIAAQSKTDAERFLLLGANPDRTRVTGNIKFDIELPSDLIERGRSFREQTLGRRPVWIAASTHDGEERVVLDVHERLRAVIPDLLLILVPRHPERFAAVRELLSKRRISFVARTDERDCDAATSVFLGDTMGEVTLFYAASDVAFVGGSLVPVGGHNLLEPVAIGVPIVMGPHVFNAQEIAERFIADNACRCVGDPDALYAAVQELLTDKDVARRLADSGRRILLDNRGALAELMALIEPLVEETAGSRP